jgi:dipeptide transport system ATP-binding protein
VSALLDVHNLRVEFGPPRAPMTAVDGVDLHVAAHEVLGIVGESGSGKSVTMLALLGLIEPPSRVSADGIDFDGADLLHMGARQRRAVLGRGIAIVFQDALASLDPAYTVGFQIGEVLTAHMGLRGAERQRRVVELLEQVEIPAATQRAQAYPHQLSGGMNQRVTIAIALACNPRLLIADEPTTALDVTVQAQIMALLGRLQADRGMALVLISHDLALVAQQAQRVAVMYAGQVVESAAAQRLFEAPRHPYSAALLAALPEHNKGARRLAALGGVVPGLRDRPRGCLFAPRCAHARTRCHGERPPLEHGVRCFFPLAS